ncbi:hypothetical protein [Rubripirellula reticaptiva]|uniref:Uncharacterized protein n=1 Tax=Rubripirellula reticaptiva TaxID=2528013 RepID=A0A5C6EH29_9BACT|nr:hypothetical protein [Rubripirellula reticaptiva]TWU46906.1 hypothetical protein Poly59_58800 [Rubripirellula reticaptiva]
MTISTSISSFSGRPLPVENLQQSGRTPAAIESSAATRFSRSSQGLSRINALVENIHYQLGQANQTDPSFRDHQSLIDRSLDEIGELLGKPRSIGDANDPVFEGLNLSQIVAVEVLSLPANAQAMFAGDVSQENARAQSFVADAERLRSGGSLKIDTGDQIRSIMIRPGTSLAGIAERINSENVGVRAAAFSGHLKLTSDSTSSLEADAEHSSFSKANEENQTSDLNGLQTTDVGISSLQPEKSQVESGGHDSLATEAPQSPTANASEEVEGSATFDEGMDPNTLQSGQDSLRTSSGDGQGPTVTIDGNLLQSVSSSRSVNVNGESVLEKNGRYEFNQNGLRLSVEFAKDFSGKFDTFAVSTSGSAKLGNVPTRPLDSAFDEQSVVMIQKALGGLFEIASGGAYSSRKASPKAAYAITIDALEHLNSLTGYSTQSGRALSGTAFDRFA